MGRFRQLSFLSMVLAVTLAACTAPDFPGALGAGPAATPAEPKRLTMAIIFDPITVFPGIDQRQASASAELQELVNARLTRSDQEDVLYPQLAQAVPTAENGLWKVFPDGTMETTWRLQDGVTWHDGMLLTTDDFVFALHVYRDADLPYFSSVVYTYIDSVTAPDPQTLIVRWNRLFINADSLSATPMPKHLVEPHYISNKAGLLELPLWSTEAVGSGPYRVQQFERGSHAVLQAFDRYVLGRPKIDTIEVRFIQDQNTLAANLLAGAIGVTIGRGLSVEQAVTIRNSWPEGRIAEHVYKSWVRIHPQFIDPNPRVILEVPFRQALLHAIDRQQIVDTIQEGVGAVSEMVVSIGSPHYAALQAYLTTYPYDARKAVQLIEGLGYTRGADGFFIDSAGNKLSVELRTTADNAARIRALAVVADDWQRAGVAVEQTIVARQLQGDREYRQTRCCFEVNRGGASMDGLTAYHSRGIQTYENNFRGVGGLNYPRYGHPELDTLIERYERAIPMAERLNAAGQIIRHMTGRVVQMGLYYDVQPVMVHKRVSANFIGYTWNAHEWDVVS